jgi:hypothetical protein
MHRTRRRAFERAAGVTTTCCRRQSFYAFATLQLRRTRFALTVSAWLADRACSHSPPAPIGLRRGSLLLLRERRRSKELRTLSCQLLERGLPSRSSRRQAARARWASARQPSLASRAKAGGGRRTRTFEVIRRLIYSQLPLPLGTLPRPTTSQAQPLRGGDQAMDDVNTVSRWRAPGRARLWAKGGGKVNQGKPLKAALGALKLPYSGTRDTSTP